IDAAGLIVAPGFVDIHSHADWILPLPDHPDILAPLLLQGVTTVIAGQCGFSPAPVTDASVPWVDAFSEAMRDRSLAYPWHTTAEFLNTLDGQGLLLNAACFVGHGTLRLAALADARRAPTPSELDLMRRELERALDDGAIGLSAGLAYAPGIFAANDELLSLLEVVAARGAVFAVHGRAYTWVSPFYKPMIGGTAHNVRSVRELLGLARAAGVRLQLSHQIFVGRHTWRTHRRVLDEIDRAAAEGVDVTFDAYPYTYGNTLVNVVMPAWFLHDFEANIVDVTALRRLKREMDLLRFTLGIDYADIMLLWAGDPELAHLEGLDFVEIARHLGMPPFDAYVHVARATGGQARALLGTYSGDETREEPLRAALAHPLCAFMTDTILTSQGVHNPASFGTFPRLLGHYSRDLGLFTLEETVRRMTSFPAERMRLEGIGRVAQGCRADLVLFDPATVDGQATLTRPDAPPIGIHAVLLGGHVVVRDGARVVDGNHGRVLRRTA
ncbi:MAG TPA: amidohydrolase family protein, partial [Anaerolineae bacterium]|nr:amidohydrolase family protein [Anaerolineae bacterium]